MAQSTVAGDMPVVGEERTREAMCPSVTLAAGMREDSQYGLSGAGCVMPRRHFLATNSFKFQGGRCVGILLATWLRLFGNIRSVPQVKASNVTYGRWP